MPPSAPGRDGSRLPESGPNPDAAIQEGFGAVVVLGVHVQRIGTRSDRAGCVCRDSGRGNGQGRMLAGTSHTVEACLEDPPARISSAVCPETTPGTGPASVRR